ncbi:phage tail protein [Streptomyces sparsogenes]|uniref:phage tail protein n=1 Tax=Streptomyces sparsogenes TaxID=67365 RepID=UPI0033DE7C22
MRLLDITATAHPDGNRIDLRWKIPPPQEPGKGQIGVRVRRGLRDYPATPDDGVLVKEGIGLSEVSDEPLQGETTYYYTLFPFTLTPGNPPLFPVDPPDHAIAMALSPYDFGGLMYSLLPAVYHRYDAETVPPTGAAGLAGAERGQLRRFLDLPGGELNRLYSHARAALAFLDPQRVDGRLLPLLAQWIGWRTDHRLPLDSQRNQIRFAPRIYQSIGGVHALDATVARVTGWTNRTKEFVHNVARTNQPERLNLWSALRDSQGEWSKPELASLDFAHDGRPAAVARDGGSAVFFYHTRRVHGWDIWTKGFADGAWQPSEPVISRPGVDKHPTVAAQGERLHLFWQGLDPAPPPEDRAPPPSADPTWRIWFSVREGKQWSEPVVFRDRDTARRTPAATADDAGGVWLFWLEREAGTAGTWRLRYNRRNTTGWQLPVPAALPLEGDSAPRAEEDLLALFHPGAATAKLWLFWARREPLGEGRTRWHILYRSKRGLDPAIADDWSGVRRLPPAEDHHDRGPAALAPGDKAIELFWSSTRAGGWTTFRNVLDTGTDTWGTSQQVFAGPHSMRAPLAVTIGDRTLLVHRSNRSVEYVSETFSATRTLDHRYAGTTTVDTRAKARLALRGGFEDFQTYLYDTGPSGTRVGKGRVARDCVGLYLDARGEPPAQVAEKATRLSGVLGEFMPVTARPVFITE